MTLSSSTTTFVRRDTDDITSIRQLIDARVRAIRAKNIDALLSQYATDICAFDMVEPLASRGLESVRRRVREWFASFASSIDYEITGVEIDVSGAVAFDHHFVHVRGTNRGGQAVDMWFRETVGWRKERGSWKVAHQHSSVPFDMRSMKAKLGLHPMM